MGESSFASGLQERLRCLQEFTSFTESCQTELDDLFEALGWNPEAEMHAARMEVCPYDPNHTAPQDRMEKHKAVCRLTQMGYSKEEQDEMYDPSVFYEKANVPSITLDKYTLQQIILQKQQTTGLLQSGESTDLLEVPLNHKRALCDLTVEDRLAVYDHSRLEVLAEMRDYRRRRQSYRAKNVHITKKTYTEVIREVIDVHSEELGKIWREEEEEEESRASKRSPQRDEAEKARSASVESRDSRVSTRHKKHHKRSRSRKRSRVMKKVHERDSNSTDVEKRHKKKKKHKSSDHK
ncbi:hypothetical protein DNTS_000352 [Danionella cerebrum]|uniref:CHHC U11-48K-type domain-containing protein n=1 Tax=Danionella cerebrum TaxID=2873325 RepID=A0A553R5T4_9TELE|nr:hypothetical protein DNTS_000352 [Danionella translucida]